MNNDNMPIVYMTRITVKAKRKLKQDAQNLGMPMNRYLEQLILGSRTALTDGTPTKPEQEINEDGSIELEGGGTFTPSEAYKHLRITKTKKNPRKSAPPTDGILRIRKGTMETSDSKFLQGRRKHKE